MLFTWSAVCCLQSGREQEESLCASSKRQNQEHCLSVCSKTEALRIVYRK